MVSNHQIRLLLEALEYPGAQTFTLQGIEHFRTLVFSLEDKYIRAMKEGDRDSIGPDSLFWEWEPHFCQYLETIKCGIAYQPEKNEEKILEWLLHLAVSYAHEDAFSSVDLTAGGTQTESGKNNGSEAAAAVPGPPDWDTPQARLLVRQLGEKLQIDDSSASLADTLHAARDVLERKQGAGGQTLAAGGIPKTPHPESSDAEASLSCLEAHRDALGFTTQDRDVDLAATLMRMLFIKDLRRLQDSIDDAIVDVQEFTQNPKANAKLGLVGR